VLREDGAVSGPSDPPHGLPVDPWAEQARRRDEAQRLRRRHATWIGGAVALVLVVVVVAVVLAVARRGAGPASAPASVTPAASTTEAAGPETTAPPRRPPTLARLDEVWLIDRLDGTYEWGLTVRSTADEDRGPLVIEASLRDDDRAEVARARDSIAELAAGAAATIGGVVTDPPGTPTRLAVDVTVGRPLDHPALGPDAIQVVALDRRGAAATGAEVIAGRLRSRVAVDVVGIRLALLWRDERGEVSAAVYHDVERVRPGIEAYFEIPVGEGAGGEGLPSDVSWSRR